MEQPLISIVVPVYNAEKHLKQMLDSVIQQTYLGWELLLIDDGSSDGSADIMATYVAKDGRIRQFYQSNSGPSVARNKGIKEANGTYICFIDADDWVSPLYLEKLIEPMLKFSPDLVVAGYYEVNSQFPQGLELHDFKKESFNKNLDKKSYQSNLFDGVSGVLWAKLFKKEIFDKHDIKLNPRLRLSEDLIVVIKYSTFVESAYITPESIYYYNRLNEQGLSGRLALGNYEDLEVLFEELDKFKAELDFLDLTTIKNKKRSAYMIKLLNDHMTSKKEFYEIADIVHNDQQLLDSNYLLANNFNNIILKWVFSQKYLQVWIILKVYHYLRTLKHG